MPETWVYVVGGIIIAVIAIIFSLNLLSMFIDNTQREFASREFSNLFMDISTICDLKLNDSVARTYSFPFQVRVIYATNDTTTVLPEVENKIKNADISRGVNVCMQFKNEQQIRCRPEPYREDFSCNLSMPFLGVLPENEDLMMKVGKILGRPDIKEYFLVIKKVGGKQINVTFYK